ncbi:hypothetical protein ACFY97_26775 [Streptomyces klenkii]|uniref:hypothetical protein n=1 Tax=Streptomyces klenkii TaxID=1420899 RepID=UPI0036E3487F
MQVMCQTRDVSAGRAAAPGGPGRRTGCPGRRIPRRRPGPAQVGAARERLLEGGDDQVAPAAAEEDSEDSVAGGFFFNTFDAYREIPTLGEATLAARIPADTFSRRYLVHTEAASAECFSVTEFSRAMVERYSGLPYGRSRLWAATKMICALREPKATSSPPLWKTGSSSRNCACHPLRPPSPHHA